MLRAITQVSRWMEALPSSTCGFSAQVMLGKQKGEENGGLNSRVLYGPGLRHIITFHRSLLECSHVAYLMQRSLGNVAVFTRRRGNAGDQPAISATGSKGRMVITGKWQPPQVEKIPIGLPFRWSSQKILIPNYSFDKEGWVHGERNVQIMFTFTTKMMKIFLVSSARSHCFLPWIATLLHFFTSHALFSLDNQAPTFSFLPSVTFEVESDFWGCTIWFHIIPPLLMCDCGQVT